MPVILQAQPGTSLDRAARVLSAVELREAADAGRDPLVLVGAARPGPARTQPVLFVQLQSPRECGSAGCSTTAYQNAGGAWRKVLDGVSGPTAALPTHHKGFADLKVGDDRYAWTGTAYASLSTAPQLDLRGSVLRHRAAVRAAAGRTASRPSKPARPAQHLAPVPARHERAANLPA